MSPSESTFEGLVPATTDFQEFVIISRDFYSNPLTSGGNSIELVLRNRVIGVESAVIDYFIESLDLTDGQYKVFYTATISDYYVLSIRSNGEHLKESPFTFFIDPGTSNGPQSVAFGDGLRNGIRVDSPPMSFEISTADAYGNYRTSGGTNVSITVELQPSPVPIVYPLVKKSTMPYTSCPSAMVDSSCVSIVDTSTGQYSVEYVTSVSGQYAIHVMIFGQHTQSSPFIISVLPGDATAFGTTALGRGLLVAEINTIVNFVIQLGISLEIIGQDAMKKMLYP